MVEYKIDSVELTELNTGDLIVAIEEYLDKIAPTVDAQKIAEKLIDHNVDPMSEDWHAKFREAVREERSKIRRGLVPALICNLENDETMREASVFISANAAKMG